MDRLRSLLEEYKVSSKLNPKIWDANDNLRPDVSLKIKEIVSYFISFIEEQELPIAVVDTWLVGSNCSYNYTDHSDLDVHIIVNTSIAGCGAEFLLAAYNAYRSNFNSKFDISINGIPVELYVEDLNTTVNSNGIYSMNKGWLKFPKMILPQYIPTSDLDFILKTEYDAVMENPTVKGIDDLINRLYLLRKEGITIEGEYSPKNQAFKNFRDDGYLDLLKQKKNELISIKLSKGGN